MPIQFYDAYKVSHKSPDLVVQHPDSIIPINNQNKNLLKHKIYTKV